MTCMLHGPERYHLRHRGGDFWIVGSYTDTRHPDHPTPVTPITRHPSLRSPDTRHPDHPTPVTPIIRHPDHPTPVIPIFRHQSPDHPHSAKTLLQFRFFNKIQYSAPWNTETIYIDNYVELIRLLGLCQGLVYAHPATLLVLLNFGSNGKTSLAILFTFNIVFCVLYYTVFCVLYHSLLCTILYSLLCTIP